MPRLEGRGPLYVACMAIAIVLPLLILWRGQFGLSGSGYGVETGRDSIQLNAFPSNQQIEL